MPVAEAGLNTPLEGPKSITKPGIAVTMGCAARYSCHSSASVTLLRLISRAISGQSGSVRFCGGRPIRRKSRSEEHTSELQSLMRISYAVFCLKKKTHKQKNNTHIQY